jgi:hypothetical protein
MSVDFKIPQSWQPENPPESPPGRVEGFVRNGQTAPPLLTDASRWRRLTVLYPEVLSVRWMDDSLHRYRTEYAPAKRSLAFFAFFTAEPKKREGAFTYALPDKDHVVLQGTLLEDALTVRLRRLNPSQLPLVARGFHWVSEFPINR